MVAMRIGPSQYVYLRIMLRIEGVMHISTSEERMSEQSGVIIRMSGRNLKKKSKLNSLQTSGEIYHETKK